MKFWATRSICYHAKPGVRGLVVEPNPDGTGPDEPRLYPWSHVDCRGGRWWALDEEGRPLRENGRMVHFDLRSTHASNVAASGQRRWMRQALGGGKLAVTERLQPTWYYGCLAPLYALGFLYLFGRALVGFVRLLGSEEWQIMPPPYRTLFWFVAGSVLAMWGAAFVAIAYIGIAVLTARRPRRITFHGNNATAIFSSSQQHCFTWNDVIRLRPLGRLALANRQVVAIAPCTSRTQSILVAARERYFPELVAKTRRRYGLAPVLLVIWSLLGAIAVGWCTKRFAISPDGDASPSTIAAAPWLLALCVLAIGGAAAIATSPLPAKLARWWYRRQRRANRMRRDATDSSVGTRRQHRFKSRRDESR